MPRYSPEQQQMIALALRLSRGMPRRVRKSLLEAMAVESGFRNLNYGDRDSQGVLQQRPSTGWGPPGNAKQDIKQYLARALATNRGFRGSAGQLAQAIQRSAFPERYDQRRGEANALLGGANGGGGGGAGPLSRPTSALGVGDSRQELAMALLQRLQGGPERPSVMDIVNIARQPAGGAGGAQGARRSPGRGIRPGGGWGGSKGMVGSLTRGLGLPVTSEKRDRKNTASGGVSDHWVGSKTSWASDLGGSVSEMDRAAVRIARRLGIRYRKGQPLNVTVNRNGYRIQVLYRTATGGNHFDHLHVGARRV